MMRDLLTALPLSLLLLPVDILSQPGPARTFADMPDGDARATIETLMDTRQLPPPPGSAPPLVPGTWQLPPSGLYARGARVNEDEYLVFAAVLPSGLLYLGAPGRELERGPFVPNGVFFTSIDLDVQSTPPSSVKANHRIPRGGYNWSVSQSGLLLQGGFWDAPGKPAPEVLMEFDTPFNKFPVDPLPLDLVELTTNQDTVVLRIRGKSLVLSLDQERPR
jgi:hypothetical protein